MRKRHVVATTLAVAALATGVVLHGSLAGPSYIYPLVPGVTNPDITQSNISQNICAGSAWSTKSIRPSTSYTGPIKVTDIAIYNQKFGTHYSLADGELDHLISIELGGSPTDPNNLWYEPYITQINGQEVGAREKDKTENDLHAEVCAGTKTLAEAQSIIVSDWYKYYLAKRTNPTFGGVSQYPLDQDDN